MLFLIFKRVSALLVFTAISLSNTFSSDFSNLSGFETGNTPIIDAVSAKDYKSLEFFIKISPQSVNKQNIGGATALHIAARNNDLQALKILMMVGADPNIRDLEGYTAPLRACQYKNEELFSQIATTSKVRYDIKNSDGDGFVTISTLAKSYDCLKTSLNNIIPLRDIGVSKLKNDLKNAFIIAVAKNDEKSKNILLKYLDNLHNFEKTMSSLDSRPKTYQDIEDNIVTYIKKPMIHQKFVDPSMPIGTGIYDDIQDASTDKDSLNANNNRQSIKKSVSYRAKNNLQAREKSKKYILKQGSMGLILDKEKFDNQGVVNRSSKRKVKYRAKRSKTKIIDRKKNKIIKKDLKNPGQLIQETIIID